SRGISQDPFYVLWRTAMPAVLVECGFMSNSTDREALITEKGRDRIASDLYDAFCKYKLEYDGVGSKAAPAKPKAEAAPEPEPRKVETVPEEAPVEGIIYGTQVLVSSRVMPGTDPFFKGMDPKRYPAGKLYKYIVCLSTDLEEARKKYEGLKKDYPDSFLVKIEGEEVTRIK
ncbi:MAG: N-acetylmuramoyl-L-alanine amidase, partial [Bacteroidales bacterium]|nr:N-acetylmuramoyl-L-alanine amidase [Bacteroidales bacterium]